MLWYKEAFIEEQIEGALHVSTKTKSTENSVDVPQTGCMMPKNDLAVFNLPGHVRHKEVVPCNNEHPLCPNARQLTHSVRAKAEGSEVIIIIGF